MNHTNVIYETALYLRLSRDDRDILERGATGKLKIESNSIVNQRELLRAYVQSHEDLRIFDIYMDDGFSGANFDRPEFQRMIEDINRGKINCVLTKDLSRFGRDYIMAGKYLQKIFPTLGVRFIAVTDNYDSLTADAAESYYILPIKNFVNDSYCRDISMKVKAQQRIKRLEGKCISAFPVYGYQKHPQDKNQLMIDDYAAGIVRKVFEWKIEGMSLAAIAKQLNEQAILSPMEYKIALGMKYHSGFSRLGAGKWSAVAVKRILTNPVYIGTLIQGKEECINYKVHKRRNKPESEWIRVDNTHEPIMAFYDFQAVQRLMKYDGRKSKNTNTANTFSGFLICGDCKTPMIKRSNTYKGIKTEYYICQTKNKSQGCSRHSIAAETLKRIVLTEIKAYTILVIEGLKDSSMLEQLDRRLLTATIEHIYIYENKRLEICFRGQNIFNKSEVT